MEIWLDTIDLATIEKALKMGLLHGVTTNPSILSKAENRQETVRAVLSAQPGPVTVQVVALDTPTMVEQGRKLRAFSPKIIVKVPVTAAGLEAIHILSKENIPVMGTVIFHPNQALLAAIAGASYVAPYFSRMQKSGDNPLIQIESMMKMMRQYQFKTKVLAASLKTTEQIRACAELGFHAVTVKEDLFGELVETHELTAFAVEQFQDEWGSLPFIS